MHKSTSYALSRGGFREVLNQVLTGNACRGKQRVNHVVQGDQGGGDLGGMGNEFVCFVFQILPLFSNSRPSGGFLHLGKF